MLRPTPLRFNDLGTVLYILEIFYDEQLINRFLNK